MGTGYDVVKVLECLSREDHVLRVASELVRVNAWAGIICKCDERDRVCG